jgi:hypothetical protein
MSNVEPDLAPRQLLVDMLREASKLEHCLLDTYLAAACSLKSTPQEFATIGGKENQRRAVQFERVRSWKQAILSVAHEEMRHLHFVQCLLRALGEPAYLGLPDRTAEGVWNIPNWRIQIGSALPAGEKGVDVPVRPLDLSDIKRFVLYESSDALQDEDPFGEPAQALYKRLHAFELDLHFEGMLVGMPAGTEKEALVTKLRFIYEQLPPVPPVPGPEERDKVAAMLPPLEALRFRSIADFYKRGILPLYEQAFDSGWVVNNDRNLIDEQLTPDYAREGFLPIGPVGRSLKFARFAKQVQTDPLTDYRRVDDIVKEIVEEGEGAPQFRRRAEMILDKVKEIGVGAFLKALADDARPPTGYETPEWLADAQMLRKSHLYVFAMIMVEYQTELNLASGSGVQFDAARAVLPATDPGLPTLVKELPGQFNACYLAMLAWLSRMYEPREWAADTPRRIAIEMIATWPLMSLAIRPFLELASFFPIKWNCLFRIDRDSLPMLPVWAQELLDLWQSNERSESINERMDYLAVRTLRAIAEWARDQLWAVDGSKIPDHQRGMIRTRLAALTKLAEFERQFPYRVAGGYSDRSPSLTYQNTHRDNSRYEENPAYRANIDNVIFADTLILRLRFRGWGLVQLATDPDPPTDESGCTGTLMLHAADGDRRFDRALVWQNFEPDRNILRPVLNGGPPLGVNLAEVSLLAPEPGQGASAGYLPLQVMSSTGAVQTSGLQQNLGISGLHEIISLKADAMMGDSTRQLRLTLETKDGVRPFLNGENHLVWQDGEPIDPFIIGLYEDAGAHKNLPKRLFQREIFNNGLGLLEMEPYQRLLSSRGPCGFDGFNNIPDWALTTDLRQALGAPGFPMSYLDARQKSLIKQLEEAAQASDQSHGTIDQIVSLAERLYLVAQPSSTTSGWLGVLLHYGHTVSGAIQVGEGENPILNELGARIGLRLGIAPPAGDRGAPNARWLAAYTKGIMDTDALSDFVYGELYVPLTVSDAGPVKFNRHWTFAPDLAGALAAFATDFSKPFWGNFTVQGDSRTESVTGIARSNPVTLTDRLGQKSDGQYTYTTEGFPNLTSLGGRFAVEPAAGQVRLIWECTLAGTNVALITCLAWLALTADQMGAALGNHFGPQ